MRRIVLALAIFAAGCSSVLGFKDPSLDDSPTDAPGADSASDGSIDAPPATELWIFTTNATFRGDFGAASGARVTADTKCDDMYQATFTNRQCTQVHAVIQIENTTDTLARMAGTFQIPQEVNVLRATDEAIVSSKWADLINPNANLIAPVNTSAARFWSGKGLSGDLQCSNWASTAGSGNAGDAGKTVSWMSDVNLTCNSIDQRLLCVCW